MTTTDNTTLIAGATGFIGRRLALALRSEGVAVRCLVRSPDSGAARALAEAGCELHEGDLLRPETLRGACEGVDVAYYLVHSMGRGGDGKFASRDREAATAFAEVARDEGVGRVVYLGGLTPDGEETSEHLRSRHEVARILAEIPAPLTYFRAAMVVGAESESYRTLLHLVRRLPVMVTPSWLSTRTQPIAVDDVIAYLVRARDDDAPEGEVQIGGPDVLPYAEMLDRMADALERPRPRKLPVPLLAPGLSSRWIGLVTPVDAAVARPLVEGLRTPTVVTDPAPARRFGVEPTPFDQALRAAVREEATA
jgi:uncharacterized protein YbjT (DUF2867 family)